MTLDQRLRDARNERGMSKAELARRAGVSVQTIFLLEKGAHADPRIDTVRRIAEALGRPLSDLLASDESSDVPETFRAAQPATASGTGLPSTDETVDEQALGATTK